MAQINPYLNFNGECEAAFNFYKSVFGGEFDRMSRYKDMPPSADKPMNEADSEKVMHVSLPISSESVLMGSDVGGEWAKHNVMGNNIQLSVNAESEEEARRIFTGLGEGGHVKMPLEKTFWAERFGMVVDRFGIPWLINCEG